MVTRKEWNNGRKQRSAVRLAIRTPRGVGHDARPSNKRPKLAMGPSYIVLVWEAHSWTTFSATHWQVHHIMLVLAFKAQTNLQD